MLSESIAIRQTKPIANGSLVLPEVDKQDLLNSSADFYGAADSWRNHCGVSSLPVPNKYRCQHGWCVQERQQIDPILLIQEPKAHSDKTYLVARQDEQDYLCRHGIKAKAIGLPYIYAKPLPAKRRSGSLLVMPAHSLEYTRHLWKFDEYVKRIKSIADQFPEVVCCIHPACEINGYWKPNFERLGIRCIAGADAADRNGLVRIKTLMNQFEFMTTNALGSHVVYAAAQGVRVSIYGDYAEYRAEDYAKTEFYKLHPHILEPVLNLISEDFVHSRYPKLFCDPVDAVASIEWAENEIGVPNRLLPKQLKKLFGWDRFSQVKMNIRAASRKLTKPSERFLKSLIKRK